MPLLSRPNFRPLTAALTLTLLLSFPANPPLAFPQQRPAAQRPGGVSASAVVTVQSSPQLFATLAALDAAGFEAESSDLSSHPLRRRLRPELLKLNGPATQALRQFYNSHTLPDRAATQSRYVSYALLAGPPPSFAVTVKRNFWPADVVNLDGFSEVLAPFFAEAGLDSVWREAQPDYDQAISQLQQPVANIVIRSSGYVREILDPARGRYFTVYVEPMIGSRIQFRNDGDQYSLVVNPAANPPLGEIQHAFLHFVLDPIVMRRANLIRRAEPLLKIAGRSPRLSREYQYDFPAFFAECLVRAAEIRLSRMSPAARETEITKLEKEGYVLVRSLDAALAGFEKSEPSMNEYFPDLIRSIPVSSEISRLEKIDFSPAEPAAETLPEGHLRTQSELQRSLADADRLIASSQNAPAAEAFERILQKYPDSARAMYGLAIASVSLGQVSRAKELFQAVVQLDARSQSQQPPPDAATQAPDPVALAWSHVYLGRIYDMEGQRDLAVTEYRAALAVAGAPEPARLAAQDGVRKPFERPRRSDSQP